MIKLALAGEVKVTPGDAKRTLGGSFAKNLDDFERQLNEVKAVYDIHKSKVSEETLTHLHL